MKNQIRICNKKIYEYNKEIDNFIEHLNSMKIKNYDEISLNRINEIRGKNTAIKIFLKIENLINDIYFQYTYLLELYRDKNDKI